MNIPAGNSNKIFSEEVDSASSYGKVSNAALTPMLKNWYIFLKSA